MTDRQTVLLLRSDHRNDLVYEEGMVQGFAPLGYDVIAVSVQDENAVETALRAVKEEPEAFLCIVSVSYYGLHLKIDDVPLHDATPVPVVMWLLDNPTLFRNPWANYIPDNPSNLVVASNDIAHIEYWHRYICADSPSVEINHGVGRHPLLSPQPQTLEQFMARDNVALLPVNFSAFGMNLEKVAEKIRLLSPVAGKVVWDAIDIGARDLLLPPFRAVEKAADARTFDLNEGTMALLTVLTDMYIKMWRREFVMSQVLDLPVRFLGTDHPEFYKLGRRNRFANVSMPAIFDDYRRARWVISIGPAFPRLVHERVLQSFDAGAAVLSERSPGVTEIFDDGTEIGTFDLTNGDVANQLADWLARPEDAFKLVQAAQAKMSELDIHTSNMRRLRDKAIELRARPWRKAS